MSLRPPGRPVPVPGCHRLSSRLWDPWVLEVRGQGPLRVAGGVSPPSLALAWFLRCGWGRGFNQSSGGISLLHPRSGRVVEARPSGTYLGWPR